MALYAINVEDMPQFNIFFGFSGPTGRPGGFDVWARRAGAAAGFKVTVEMCDIINGTDLADELIWEQILGKLSSSHGYQASLWSPPCSTFSVARHLPGGPPVLRGHTGVDLYGLANLKPADKERVRTGTLLAVRAAQGIKAQRNLGCPWILESPAPRPHCASVFSLPEITSACGTEVFVRDFVQCELGAASMKPTQLRSSFKLPDGLMDRCSHPSRWWKLPPHGDWIQAAHPPLRGRHRAVSPRSQGGERSDQFLTKAAAAYPDMLNAFLAAALVNQILLKNANPIMKIREYTRMGKWSNVLISNERRNGSLSMDDLFLTKRGPVMTVRLRPKDQNADVKRREEALAIGGMRKPQRSLTKLPLVVALGRQLRSVLEHSLLEHPDPGAACLAAIGNASNADQIPAEALNSVRLSLAKLFKVDNIEPVGNAHFSTEIRAHLLAGWRSVSQDPDWAVADWLLASGAPAGILRHPEDCGIFPRTLVGGMPPDSLHSDPNDFASYSSVESDSDAWRQVRRLVDKGWLLEFDTLDQLKAFLGADPILSKFGLVVKTRNGITKKRLILDAKASGISEIASKKERILLPRILDVAHNILNLQALGPEEVELFILDFADAFWLLPLAAEERRWFTSKLRGKYFAFLRNAQGSRNAPLCWGRLAAMIGRMTQSIYRKDEALAEIYTDDPCICLRGEKTHRDNLVAMTVLLWLCLGFPLSWAKGSRGQRADWIGASFVTNNSRAFDEP